MTAPPGRRARAPPVAALARRLWSAAVHRVDRVVVPTGGAATGVERHSGGAGGGPWVGSGAGVVADPTRRGERRADGPYAGLGPVWPPVRGCHPEQPPTPRGHHARRHRSAARTGRPRAPYGPGHATVPDDGTAARERAAAAEHQRGSHGDFHGVNGRFAVCFCVSSSSAATMWRKPRAMRTRSVPQARENRLRGVLTRGRRVGERRHVELVVAGQVDW